MKYPAILIDVNTSSSGESNQQTVLMYKDGSATHVLGAYRGQYVKFWDTNGVDNITPEYLANTYGEVKSKEHAEFIVKLAEVNGFRLCNPKKTDKKWFYFDDNELYFFDDVEDASDLDEKIITIPLPPTDTNTNTPEEDFEMQQIEKNNGDNLIFSGDNKCKEWPQVGDKVTWGNRLVTGEVKALSDGLAWVKSYHGNYRTERVELLEKPKTIEEELRDGILDCDNFDITEDKAAQIANWLTQKGYNITKKPQ